MDLIDNLIHWYYKSKYNVNPSIEPTCIRKPSHTNTCTSHSQSKSTLSPDTIQSKIKCIVCFNNNVDVILIPCGHISICKGCLDKVDRNKCPVCRTIVTRIYPFYICAWVEPE